MELQLPARLATVRREIATRGVAKHILSWKDMLPETNDGYAHRRELSESDGTDGPAVRRPARWPIRAAALAGVAMCIGATCQSLKDWSLAPELAILAALLWHTRDDVYAAVPGFAIGFVAGVIMSAGIGPAAEIDCGLVRRIAAPINAICRGFRRGGAAALMGILAYWVIVQLVLLFIFR